MKLREIITKHQQKKARQNESHLRYVPYKATEINASMSRRRK